MTQLTPLIAELCAIHTAIAHVNDECGERYRSFSDGSDDARLIRKVRLTTEVSRARNIDVTMRRPTSFLRELEAKTAWQPVVRA